MKSVLFVLGGGIGNIVQATPAIKAVASEGWEVSLLLHCNSSKDLDIFRLPYVKELHTKPPKTEYNAQLNGPFTPGTKHNCKHYLRTRVHYAQHRPEAEVYYDLAKQIGVTTPMENIEISLPEKGPWPRRGQRYNATQPIPQRLDLWIRNLKTTSGSFLHSQQNIKALGPHAGRVTSDLI